MNQRIITSFLDTDYYIITMGGFIFDGYADVPVRYGFNCRTVGANLTRYIPEKVLRRELDHMFTLRLTTEERPYLAGLVNARGERIFLDDYLDSLMDLEFPPYELRYIGDTIRLEFPGKWSEAIYWEVPALAIINQLYYEGLLNTQDALIETYTEGRGRLRDKIELLKQHPRVNFSDFGTRRRFSRLWQEHVVRTYKHELSPQQFIGTSNIDLARRYGLKPTGTMAHQLPMVFAALFDDGSDESLRTAHMRVFDEWWDKYGYELSIALTDTYTTQAFLRYFPARHASNWKGMRQDSGRPKVWTNNVVDFYERLDIDPLSRRGIFSDALTVPRMIEISQYCERLIRDSDGWGTGSTNDLGPSPISIVIKVIEAADRGTVKLSDNLNKATGSQEDKQRYMRAFKTGAIGREAVTY